jgi:hypothetical protein
MRLRELARQQLEELDRTRLLVYLGVALFAFGVEYGLERWSPETQNKWAQLGRPFEQLYQWQSSLGPRKPRSHFVRLIVLRSRTEPPELVEESNRCPQREFFSRLLPAVAAVSPALIAIDKTFSPNLNCPETDKLLKAAENTAGTVPLVVSATTLSAPNVKTEPEEFRAALEREKAVAEMPSLRFPAGVQYGIANLDIDDRKIPLTWPVYPTKESVVIRGRSYATSNRKRAAIMRRRAWSRPWLLRQPACSTRLSRL